MTTTKERVDNDIKKNLAKRIKEIVPMLGENIDKEVKYQVQGLMHDLKDLVEPGTPAFDKESAYAAKKVSELIYKGLVDYYKARAKMPWIK